MWFREHLKGLYGTRHGKKYGTYVGRIVRSEGGRRIGEEFLTELVVEEVPHRRLGDDLTGSRHKGIE